MSAPQLPTGARVPITMTSKFEKFATTVTVGKCLGSGGSASAYRIAAATNDLKIQTDGSMTPLTDLVLRLEYQLVGRMKERQEAINFLEKRRATDQHLKALVPVYASGDGTSTEVAENVGRQMALSLQLLEFAGKDLRKDLPARGLGWTRVCVGMAGVARTLEQLHSYRWVHRDISPDNLFTGFPQTSTSPFLVGDLGIITKANRVRPAVVVADGTSVLTTAWSKGPYTPPEVLRAQDDSGWMRATEYLDVWQLATTMAMLATGRLPFRGWDPGQGMRRQKTYFAGVLSGLYDPEVIKDAPQVLRGYLAQAWAVDPGQRPKMSMLTVALQAVQNNGKTKPRPAPLSAPKPRPVPMTKPRPVPAPKPRPAPIPVVKPRPAEGFKATAHAFFGAVKSAAVTFAVICLLVFPEIIHMATTNEQGGNSWPSFENLKHNTSTVLGYVHDKAFFWVEDEAKPKPKPTRAVAQHLVVDASGTLTLGTEVVGEFLADYQPQLYTAGPLKGMSMKGTLSLPAWGYCDCFAKSPTLRVGGGQFKVKIAASSTASATQTLRLGGTSSNPTGAYLVIVSALKPTYHPPAGLRLRAVSYRIPAAAAVKLAQWVTLVPANPSGYNESAQTGSGGNTIPTHWATMKLLQGKGFADHRPNQSVLVFNLPENSDIHSWDVAVVWVTEQGVLVGDLDARHQLSVSKF